MEINMNLLIENLIRGRDSTKKLQALLRRKVNLDQSSVSAADLLTEILGSFSSGISMLKSSVSGETSGFPASPQSALVDQMPEVHARKKPAPANKQRRGCYKRRRNIDCSVKISGTIEDGFAWRKYGQKVIHNSKSPRCYFRCTHKSNGCKALKQVQKLEDESNMYQITYLGHHSCPTLSHREVVLDFEDFKKHHHVSNSPSTITNIHNTPSVKQEVDSKQDQSGDVSDIVSSANDENTSPAMTWNDILMYDLGSYHEGASFMRFDHNEDSCASNSSNGYLNDDLFNNDFLSSILD
ncbi:hypothetical protein R6Q59_009080 [Mikania micrantha]